METTIPADPLAQNTPPILLAASPPLQKQQPMMEETSSIQSHVLDRLLKELGNLHI